jgi:uncharacterized protein (TIGR03435 family)
MRIGVCAVLTIVGAFGQTEERGRAQPPKLDVSSVKIHQGDLPRTGGTLSTSGLRISIRGFGIEGLLYFAYSVRGDQISSNPPLDHILYDVDALAAGDQALTRGELRLLMQSVLADRFKLRAHREKQTRPVYALVVGKNGPKFKESAPDATREWEGARDGPNIGSAVKKWTMADLATLLTTSAGLDRSVVDATGLNGEYDFRLVYTARERWMPDRTDQVDVFEAVAEQLGLKLDARIGPFEVLVIDHIEKPSEN